MRIQNVALVVAALLFSALAVADESAAGSPATSETPVATSASDTHPTDGAAPATNDEHWRFKRHNGQWWYWLPSEKWVVWSGQEWVDPAQVAREPARRSYSYDRSSQRGTTGYWDLGRWGPVNYDSYGNRQYPYSIGKRGIRQLGVVPAPGGVRALPGWGGER